jgi:hypothetical protein
MSTISARDRKKLQSLFATEVLEEVRIAGGRSVILCDQPALLAYVKKYYPSGLEKKIELKGSPRSNAIAQLRDAKKTSVTDAEILSLRAGGSVDILSKNGKLLPLIEWCDIADVAAVRLDDASQWTGSGLMAIVENLEVFLHFEKIGFETDLIYYAAGRLSERALHWLSSPGMQLCRIVHFGDYDPVGVDEYLRLKKACPGRVEMYVPDNLEALLSQYGKPALLENSKALLSRLRMEEDETARYLVSLMDIYNCGLEQEVLV